MNRLPTVIDCFCGAGGLSLGFKNAGFQTKYAFDSDEANILTYRKNLGRHGHVADIHYVSKKSIEATLKHTLGRVDVIAGGPPCQGFSVQRRGSDLDERNDLVLQFARLVFEFQPTFFLMENVGGLLAPRGRLVMQQLKDLCEANDYYLHIRKLDSSNYGVPQIRKRVFIVGEKWSGGLLKFAFPEPIAQNGGVRTVRDAIGDLGSTSDARVPNHTADKLSAINLDRIRWIKEGQGRDSLPLHLQLDCHKNNAAHRHLDTYGRMSWDKPSPTITARFDSFSRGRFGHPILDRTISLREGARLQTFPDDFVFYGSKVEVARQIGNAVPPQLAEVLARQIKAYISPSPVCFEKSHATQGQERDGSGS